jgi:hypothetical protein
MLTYVISGLFMIRLKIIASSPGVLASPRHLIISSTFRVRIALLTAITPQRIAQTDANATNPYNPKWHQLRMCFV